MNSTVILKQLQNSGLEASCPSCHCNFKLSEAVTFDGLGRLPEIAENKRDEMFETLKKRTEDLLQRRVQIDTKSEQRAISSGRGKIIEKIVPAYKQFNFPISDCRALFDPVDFIIFDGCANNKVNQIIFLDVKTGDSRLNQHQRMIKDTVEKKRVLYKVA